MHILQIQHFPPRFPYNCEAYFSRRGDLVEDCGFSPGFRPGGDPDPSRYDAVIVYGGYMSAYDDAGHPWLARELRFIERCATLEVPLLGICLGSQLFARMLGARVFLSEVPEFGFMKIRPTQEGAVHPVIGPLSRAAAGSVAAPLSASGSPHDPGFLALQWHNDAWELPSGAVRLAESDFWPNQAFAYGDRMLATQFHLEFTHAHMTRAVEEERRSIPEGSGCETPEAFLGDARRFDEIARSMELLLDGFFAWCGEDT
jgi:GMP synthase (glutamine-hydrolysing)